MKTQRQTSSSTLATMILALLFATATPVAADGWELVTTDITVPGTREIESGDADKGIRRSKARASTAMGKEKVAYLNNLCVGHILIGDFERAGS